MFCENVAGLRRHKRQWTLCGDGTGRTSLRGRLRPRKRFKQLKEIGPKLAKISGGAKPGHLEEWGGGANGQNSIWGKTDIFKHAHSSRVEKFSTCVCPVQKAWTQMAQQCGSLTMVGNWGLVIRQRPLASSGNGEEVRMMPTVFDTTGGRAPRLNAHQSGLETNPSQSNLPVDSDRSPRHPLAS